MQIAGSDFLFEQNNRLRNSLLDYSKKAAEAMPQAPAQVSPEHTQVKPAEETAGATVKISGEGVRAINFSTAPETATVFAPTEFSTESAPEAKQPAAETTKAQAVAEPEQAAAANGNSVLNQYRFFVQSALYQGEEGTVRRIS